MRSDDELRDERGKVIAERRDRIFKRVNGNPDNAMPVYDDPVDRVLGTEVAEVLDLVRDLTLFQVHQIVTDLIDSIDAEDEPLE
jgi:hypothetical protein